MSKILLEHTIRGILCNNIKKLRKGAGFTQASLADQMNVDQKRVGAWEEGRGTPPLETIIQIADLFNKDLRELLTKKIE